QISPAGSYSVDLHVKNAKGCEADFSLPDGIVVYDLPDADFHYISEEIGAERVEYTYIPNDPNQYSYYWIFQDGSNSDQDTAIKSYDEKTVGNVELRVTDSNFCSASLSKVIEVPFDHFQIFIPNSVSFNSDFINDYFDVKIPIDVNEFEASIYNRWGEKVFYSEDKNFTWNGLYGGEAV